MLINIERQDWKHILTLLKSHPSVENDRLAQRIEARLG